MDVLLLILTRLAAPAFSCPILRSPGRFLRAGRRASFDLWRSSSFEQSPHCTSVRRKHRHEVPPSRPTGRLPRVGILYQFPNGPIRIDAAVSVGDAWRQRDIAVKTALQDSGIEVQITERSAVIERFISNLSTNTSANGGTCSHGVVFSWWLRLHADISRLL